ncbi:Exocyst complex component 6B [Collichthys lucidus]|uniref:Exocyst complex component n=1 Tax=Collichthys lucidus TaxID=240159 RepID=A0A4U5VXB3_COLLU|nr:Exocyst complex component 6B [Collichthys lucidus]
MSLFEVCALCRPCEARVRLKKAIFVASDLLSIVRVGHFLVNRRKGGGFKPYTGVSVYDGQEHGLFMEKLDARIRNHDREIEKMCNHHFQGFVDSITELLKVRGEAQKLKSQVTDTNRRLQDDGKDLTGSMEELIQCRVQQRNIATTIDKLTHCLPVLEMYSRLQEQMRAKRYYPALRTLEQLEQTCLPRAGEYRFCSIMAENIPKLRTQIRDTAMTQLRDFLESIRKHSDKIGETAIKQAQLQRSLDSSVFTQPRVLLGRRSRKDAAAALAGTDGGGQGGSPVSEQDSGILDVEDEEEEEVPGAHDLVDFSPVYRCLHIYTVLGLRDVFENYYRKQRRKQARLVLQPHSNMGLVNRAYVEELWDLALSKIVAALRTHSSYCDNPDLVLDLKNLIVLFADTLQGYGFPVSQLFDMLLEMRDQYGEILLKRWNITFRQVLDQDNYSPIPVSTEEEFRHYTLQFPLQDPELEKLPFPKKLPFSEFVPKVYCQLKEFIYACLKYSEDLHLSRHFCRSRNLPPPPPLLQIVGTFLGFLRFFGKRDARHAAEAEIYTSLNAKIDQFLQLADYDWMAAVHEGRTLEPSDYLIDLIAFLKSTFSVFTNLPGSPNCSTKGSVWLQVFLPTKQQHTRLD